MFSFIKVINESFNVIPKGISSLNLVMQGDPPHRQSIDHLYIPATTVFRLECFFMNRLKSLSPSTFCHQLMDSKIHFPSHRENPPERIFKR